MMQNISVQKSDPSRREFLKASTAAIATNAVIVAWNDAAGACRH